MPKLFVEDTEIKMWEKTEVEDGSHQIKRDYYIMEVIEKTTYKSTLYSYGELSVLISKTKKFGEEYYKIVLFNDSTSSAWQIAVISAKLDIKVLKLAEDVFFVIGESNMKEIISQVSFCKLKQGGKVNDVTINFNRLNKIYYIDKTGILLSFDEDDTMENRTMHVLSLYNIEGKLIKNFYEFYDTDEIEYLYKNENGILKLASHNKSTDNKEMTEYDLHKLLEDETPKSAD